MVFMGKKYWTEEKPVYPLLQHLSAGHPYGQLLSIHDDRRQVLAAIDSFDENRDTSIA